MRSGPALPVSHIMHMLHPENLGGSGVTPYIWLLHIGNLAKKFQIKIRLGSLINEFMILHLVSNNKYIYGY